MPRLLERQYAPADAVPDSADLGVIDGVPVDGRDPLTEHRARVRQANTARQQLEAKKERVATQDKAVRKAALADVRAQLGEAYWQLARETPPRRLENAAERQKRERRAAEQTDEADARRLGELAAEYSQRSGT